MRSAVGMVEISMPTMDKSQLTLRAGYKQVDVVFIITLAAIVLVTGILILLARGITRPIIELSQAVTRIGNSGELALPPSKDRDHETSLLKSAIDNMRALMLRSRLRRAMKPFL